MHAFKQQRNFEFRGPHEITKQGGKVSKQRKMSKIIGELNARVRRKLFEEELEKKNSHGEQQENSDALQNQHSHPPEEFYDDVVDQNDETVAEFLELCNNNNEVDDNNNQSTTIDLPKAENPITKLVDMKMTEHDILVVTRTTCLENTSRVIEILHQLNDGQVNKLDIYRCKLDDAEHLACQRNFSVIFTDIDLGISNEILRVIMAIRKSNTHNLEIPIIAVEQNRANYRITDVAYFGVTNIDYAHLSTQFVKEVISKLNTESSLEAEKEIPSTKSLLSDDHACNSQQQPSLSPIYTTLDSPDCESFDKNTDLSSSTLVSADQNNITDKMDDKVLSMSSDSQLPAETTRSIPQQQPIFNSRSSPASVSLQQVPNERFKPQQQQMFTGGGITKQQHVVRPLIQHQQQQRIPINHNPMTNILPKTNMLYHAIPYYTLPTNHHPNHPHHQFAMTTATSHSVAAIRFAPYQQDNFHHQAKVINSAAEFSPFAAHAQQNMSAAPPPPNHHDDPTKHCTKERMRRERIRKCCEQFRILLPYHNQTKKLDMATVMELTVFYLRLLQKNSTTASQKECTEVFDYYFNNNNNTNQAHLVNASPAAPMATMVTNKRTSSDADLDEIIGVSTSKVPKFSKLKKSPLKSPSPSFTSTNIEITNNNTTMTQFMQPIPPESGVSVGENSNLQKLAPSILPQQQQQHQAVPHFVTSAQQQLQQQYSQIRSYFDPSRSIHFTRQPVIPSSEFYNYESALPAHQMYGAMSNGFHSKSNPYRHSAPPPPSFMMNHTPQISNDSNYFAASSHTRLG